MEYLAGEGLPEESYSYGDSQSDLPLLRTVRQGFLLRNQGFCQVQ
jgi:phosphoserine phosphatase